MNPARRDMRELVFVVNNDWQQLHRRLGRCAKLAITEQTPLLKYPVRVHSMLERHTGH
jgi:hypothetical protein